MENEQNKLTISDIQGHFSQLAGKIIWALLPIIIYAAVQLIRIGNVGDYLFILLGSIITIGAVFGYTVNELTNGVKKKKSFVAMLLSFGGFIPWLFGSYLCLYKGLWSFTHLLGGFSVLVLIEAVLFTYLGYLVVKNFHQMTEVGEIIRKGGVEIVDE